VSSTPSGGESLFAALRDIEQRCLGHAAALPQQRKAEETWEGVLFSVGGRMMTAPLEEVKEILNYPSVMTNVPGTRNWVRGVANIRGTLLPIVDLQAFLIGRTTVPGRRSRVLVINSEGLHSGLLVDQMVGIRHFRPSDKIEGKSGLPDTFERFVAFNYKHGNETWPVFSMRLLAEDPEFQFAAA